jgi:hypothetical protein
VQSPSGHFGSMFLRENGLYKVDMTLLSYVVSLADMIFF